jgi:hypothetical protein
MRGVVKLHSCLIIFGIVLHGCANLRGRPKDKIKYSHFSMNRCIQIIRNSKQDFEPYSMMLKEVKGK